MLKLFLLLSLVGVLFTLTSCKNFRAKNWGGNVTYKLNVGEKLLNVSWKDEDLWVLTRKRLPNEKCDTLIYREESNKSIREGSVTFIER